MSRLGIVPPGKPASVDMPLLDAILLQHVDAPKYVRIMRKAKFKITQHYQGRARKAETPHSPTLRGLFLKIWISEGGLLP